MSVLYIKVKFKSFLCVCVCFPLYCYDRCIICGWLQEWKHDIIGSNIWLYHVGFKKENKDEHNLHCDYSLLWHLSWQHFFQTPNAWKVLEIESRGLKPCLFFCFVLFCFVLFFWSEQTQSIGRSDNNYILKKKKQHVVRTSMFLYKGWR